jgi:hypothetical protein
MLLSVTQEKLKGRNKSKSNWENGEDTSYYKMARKGRG